MNDLTVTRDLATIENEIITLTNQAQSMALTYIIEIGRRLVEAKSIVPHGGWADWLEKRVNYSQRTANNFMKIYEEYGSGQISLFGNSSNSQPVANLNYTQLVALLALPGTEREKFIAENDVENMSKRELEKAVRESKEAMERAEAAEKKAEMLENEKAKAERYEREATKAAERASELEKSLSEVNAKLEKTKASEKRAKERLNELKNNPEIPQEFLDNAKAEAEAAAAENSAKVIEEKTSEIRDKLASAQKETEELKRAAEQAKTKVIELEKKLKLQDPVMVKFKDRFENVQKQLNELVDIRNEARESNPEQAQQLTEAIKALAKKYTEV